MANKYSVVYGGKVLVLWRPECSMLCKIVAFRLCVAFGDSVSQSSTWLHFEYKFGERMVLHLTVCVNTTACGISTG